MNRSSLALAVFLAALCLGASTWQGSNLVTTDCSQPYSWSTYSDMSQISAPSNPAAGTRRLFVDSATGKLSVRTSAGTTVSLEEQGGAGADHNMLSATHLDTTAASVVRGDLIVGIGVSPTWQRLAVGTSGQALKGGTEPAWGSVAFSELSGGISTTQHGALGAIANAHAFGDISGTVGASQFNDTSHGARTVANAHRCSDLALSPDSSTTTIGGDTTPSSVVLNVGHDGTNALANTFNIAAHTHTSAAGTGGQIAMSSLTGAISTTQHGSLGAITNAHAFSDISGAITAAQHGALGSGASHTTAQPVTVADEGSNVTNTPHTRLNFTGAGVSVADGGSGTATVTISGGGGGGPATVKTTGNQTINGNAFQNVTDLTFSVTSGTTYLFDFLIVFQSAATTTGFGFSVDGPATPTLLSYIVEYQTTANATAGTDVITQRKDTAYDAMAATTSTVAQAVDLHARIRGTLIPSANGTLAARVRSELANNNLTVRTGSCGILWTL